MTEEQFLENYCKFCGSLICTSPYDDYADGCQLLKKIIKGK